MKLSTSLRVIIRKNHSMNLKNTNSELKFVIPLLRKIFKSTRFCCCHCCCCSCSCCCSSSCCC